MNDDIVYYLQNKKTGSLEGAQNTKQAASSSYRHRRAPDALWGFFIFFYCCFRKKTHTRDAPSLLTVAVVDIAAARVCTREVAIIYNVLTIIIWYLSFLCGGLSSVNKNIKKKIANCLARRAYRGGGPNNLPNNIIIISRLLLFLLRKRLFFFVILVCPSSDK